MVCCQNTRIERIYFHNSLKIKHGVKKTIPIVDLFAGPGGLGEGFSSVKSTSGQPVFKVAVSIEKDEIAHKTLSLRAAFRQLRTDGTLDSYYEFLRGEREWSDFSQGKYVKEALAESIKEARCAELGKDDLKKIDDWIRDGIGGSPDWLLIGGPPCQAYSLAGRSRRTNDKLFEKDEKHFLYKEYLRILRKFAPPVFVMENVKGMLSSTHGGEGIFSRILDDLSCPQPGLEYEVRSFAKPDDGMLAPKDYVIRAENYGIPQARHRVILLGVRKDWTTRSHVSLRPAFPAPTVEQILGSLPKIRSTLSRGRDSQEDWYGSLCGALDMLGGWKHKKRDIVEQKMSAAIKRANKLTSTGGRYIPSEQSLPESAPAALVFLNDPSLGGVCQHEARGHMRSDLQRYIFAASYSAACGVAPKLSDFPAKLLPDHSNALLEEVPFEDRFRVQIKDSPSTTIVAHIAKDGHYYIHFDPAQCRSLTVREAARLQTFPDNYFFQGTRTQQYAQIGNAVPPYLAKQLAEVVATLMGASVNLSQVGEPEFSLT